jgi:prevent-host-death family protein
MRNVTSESLRDDTTAILEQVESGEEVIITMDGRPVARLCPVSTPRRWIPRSVLTRLLAEHRTDPGFGRELHALAPETTDDLLL